MLNKILIILALASIALGSIDFGKCRDDAKSGVYEQCEMDCHADGLCYEEVSSEICDCNMDGIFYWTKYTFENGTIVSVEGNREKRHLWPCTHMKRRCEDCIATTTHNAHAGSARTWISEHDPNQNC